MNKSLLLILAYAISIFGMERQHSDLPVDLNEQYVDKLIEHARALKELNAESKDKVRLSYLKILQHRLGVVTLSFEEIKNRMKSNEQDEERMLDLANKIVDLADQIKKR